MEEGAELYDAAYAATYLGDYHAHPFWRPKVEENRRRLAGLSAQIPPGGVWIDLCCGAGQHFAGARVDLRCIGIDGSAAQIDTARRLHAGAPHEFVLEDVRRLAARQLPRADLITVFWGALSYLPDASAWRDVLAMLAAQIRPTGHVYLENLTVTALMDFNRSSFASATGFRVLSVEPDAEQGFHRWVYADRGGRHELLTPDFATLQDALAAFGLTARRESVVQTVEQIVAWVDMGQS